MDKEQVIEAAGAVGLRYGRHVAFRKATYLQAFPRRVVIFGAHLTDEAGNDLWYGDLDLTVDEQKLLDLADALGEELFLMDDSSLFNAAFGTPLVPATQAVLVLHPGRVTTRPPGPAWTFTRGPGGRFMWRPRPPVDPKP
jgi:hypothetical protein